MDHSSTSVRRLTHRIRTRSRGVLPRWHSDGAVYHVIARLADSLPSDVERSIRERHQIRVAAVRRENGRLSLIERTELILLLVREIDHALDQAHGSCLLENPRIGEMLRNAALRFRDRRYSLIATAVMPNHWHLVLRPFEGHELGAIIGSLKRFTDHRISQILGSTGPGWQPGFFDLALRNDEELRSTVQTLLSARHSNFRRTGSPGPEPHEQSPSR